MKIAIPRVFDAHLHLRDEPLLDAVLPCSAAVCSAAVVMPNVPAIETAEDVRRYSSLIESKLGPASAAFTPLMTLKLTHRTPPELVDFLARNPPGIVAAKLYPEGTTTGSREGIRDVKLLAPVLAQMQRSGVVLCVHGEEPRPAYVLDRERLYLDKVAWIVKNFPGLKVVLEHVTTREAIDFVRDASVNVAATITAHHLAFTLDDVLGDGCRPHNFCYPVPKSPEDRMALRRAVWLQDCDRFFFGSDSAPHLRGDKESGCGCAGVFSAPTMVPYLAQHFHGCVADRLWEMDSGPDLISKLANFTSRFGRKFYGLVPAEAAGELLIEQADWVVPAEVGGVVPFLAGETLRWRVS